MINQEPSHWNQLGKRLSDIFKERADKVAFVKGAEEVPFAQVAHAIDIMRGAGINHVGLITPTGNFRKQPLSNHEDRCGINCFGADKTFPRRKGLISTVRSKAESADASDALRCTFNQPLSGCRTDRLFREVTPNA